MLKPQQKYKSTVNNQLFTILSIDKNNNMKVYRTNYGEFVTSVTSFTHTMARGELVPFKPYFDSHTNRFDTLNEALNGRYRLGNAKRDIFRVDRDGAVWKMSGNYGNRQAQWSRYESTASALTSWEVL